MLGFKNKSPQERYRIADNRMQKLREKRSQQSDESKKMGLNKKIHKCKIEKEIAMTEMKHPSSRRTNVTTNISFNRKKEDKSIQIHGHYHRGK